MDDVLSTDKASTLLEEALHGKLQRFEWQYKRMDGTDFEVEVSLNRIDFKEEIVIQAIVSDITKQKQSIELARKLSPAVEQNTASIIITNTLGEIEYVNPKFTEITGYTFNDTKGNTPNILKSGFKSTEEYSMLWNTILSDKIWKGEFKNIKKMGNIIGN